MQTIIAFKIIYDKIQFMKLRMLGKKVKLGQFHRMAETDQKTGMDKKVTEIPKCQVPDKY